MKPLSTLSVSGNIPVSLAWRQPRFSEDFYELGDNPASDALYATIGWPKWLSDMAIAHSAVGIWQFDRLGWTRGTIVATRPVEPSADSGKGNLPASVQVASFEVGWFWEGDIVLSSGEVYHWWRTKTFRNAWALTEVISEDEKSLPTKMVTQRESTRNKPERKGFRLRRSSKPVRKEKLVYEIEFGLRGLKQENWVTLPAHPHGIHPELVFLLCLGMYLGYCYNMDSAAAIAGSVTAAVV